MLGGGGGGDGSDVVRVMWGWGGCLGVPIPDMLGVPILDLLEGVKLKMPDSSLAP